MWIFAREADQILYGVHCIKIKEQIRKKKKKESVDKNQKFSLTVS